MPCKSLLKTKFESTNQSNRISEMSSSSKYLLRSDPKTPLSRSTDDVSGSSMIRNIIVWCCCTCTYTFRCINQSRTLARPFSTTCRQDASGRSLVCAVIETTGLAPKTGDLRQPVPHCLASYREVIRLTMPIQI